MIGKSLRSSKPVKDLLCSWWPRYLRGKQGVSSMELITSEENGNSNITYWMFSCKIWGADVGIIITVRWIHALRPRFAKERRKEKKNKREKNASPCTKEPRIFLFSAVLSNFAVLRYQSVGYSPFYFTIEIMLDDAWKRRGNSARIIISGAISIRFRDERIKRKDEEKVRYARLLPTSWFTNKSHWFC